jgi:hypothetical protein
MEDEIILLQRLQKNDIQAFKMVCVEFSLPLEDVAFDILKDANKARETVTNVLGRMLSINFLNASPPIFEFLCEEIRKDCM